MNATILAMFAQPKLRRCVRGKRPTEVAAECLRMLSDGWADIGESRRLTFGDAEDIRDYCDRTPAPAYREELLEALEKGEAAVRAAQESAA